MFSWEDIWEEEREKRVEMGEEGERGEGEEKIKSAYGKNEFCDHIAGAKKSSIYAVSKQICLGIGNDLATFLHYSRNMRVQ